MMMDIEACVTLVVDFALQQQDRSLPQRNPELALTYPIDHDASGLDEFVRSERLATFDCRRARECKDRSLGYMHKYRWTHICFEWNTNNPLASSSLVVVIVDVAISDRSRSRRQCR